MSAKEPSISVSSQARQFITESSSADWEMVDLSPGGVAVLRQDNSDVGLKAWEAVKKDCPVVLEDGLVGSVPVQWVAPAQLAGSEIIMYMFGGGFVVGSPEDDLSMTARLAQLTGRRICVPRYRLAPEHPFPAARDDILAVYRSLQAMERVAVIGESAGGNLALGVILSATADVSLSMPVAVALLSPWIDLTHSGDSHTTLAGKDPTLSTHHFLEPASLAYAGDHPTSGTDISPLFAEIVEFPPALISTATRDLLLSDSVRLATKLRAANCQVDLRVAEGLWHVFEWYPQCPEAVESLRGIATFLKLHLESPS